MGCLLLGGCLFYLWVLGEFGGKEKPRSCGLLGVLRVVLVVWDSAVLLVGPWDVWGFGAFHVVDDLFAFGVVLCDGVVWVVVEEEFIAVFVGFVEPFGFGFDGVHWVVVNCGYPKWVLL